MLAYYDELTGLGNSRAKNETILKEMDRASRSGSGLCVIVADLNGLKRINDLKGHRSGDTLIRRAAAAIKRSVRSYDTACRTGGDEFVVILPNSDKDNADTVAARISSNCSRKGVSISVGTASIAELGKRRLKAASAALRLEHLADKRMYADKRKRAGTAPKQKGY